MKVKTKLPAEVRKYKTPLSAIHKHCLECSGNSREEVKHCPITHCALWTFRNETLYNEYYKKCVNTKKTNVSNVQSPDVPATKSTRTRKTVSKTPVVTNKTTRNKK